MSDTADKSAKSQGPREGAFGAWTTVVKTDLQRIWSETRTIVIAALMVLPVAIAAILVHGAGIDGLSTFTVLVDGVLFPFLVPLTAIFLGAPILVDEIERETLIYLTLRPIPKRAIFAGKWAAGAAIGVGLALVATIGLYLVCVVPSADFGVSGIPVGRTVVAAAVGVATYAAVFAALGALFATSMLASVVYYMVFELVLSRLPVLELISVRYHLLQAAGSTPEGDGGMIQSLLPTAEFQLPWWSSLLGLIVLCGVGLAVGSTIFKHRQYTN